MSVQGAIQHHFLARRFVEDDVFVKWPKHDEETPVTQAWMSQAGRRAKKRMRAIRSQEASTAVR